MIHYETKPVHGVGVNDLNRDYLNPYMREFHPIDEFCEGAYRRLDNLNLATRVNGGYIPTIAGGILRCNRKLKGMKIIDLGAELRVAVLSG